jgi:transposase
MEQIVHVKCCGLDVHQGTVVACVLAGESKAHKQVKTFRTVRSELEDLRAWLLSLGVTALAMEGTGVYWRPVNSVLEGHVDIHVVNARHFRNVPGRKTDVTDAHWLATLLRLGLLRKSFVPSKEIRALRDLSRYRRTLVHDETSTKNRILKLLETAGIKLASFASDVFGVSGMRMLRAIAKGDQSPQQIADLARGKLRSKRADLRLALDVLIEDHHRLMLDDQLKKLDQLGENVARYDTLLEARVAPYDKAIEALQTIDGIKRASAIEIFAEIGPDLSSFPTDGHFASWAGTCPGNHESAGKKYKVRRRRGNPYLQSALVECALAASRKKNTYLREKYHRLKARRPPMTALFAIAHKLSRAVYRVTMTGKPYVDLGAGYLDARDKAATAKRLATRLRAITTPDELAALFGLSSPASTAPTQALPTPTTAEVFPPQARA